jgi:hypothetical protein
VDHPDADVLDADDLAAAEALADRRAVVVPGDYPD